MGSTESCLSDWTLTESLSFFQELLAEQEILDSPEMEENDAKVLNKAAPTLVFPGNLPFSSFKFVKFWFLFVGLLWGRGAGAELPRTAVGLKVFVEAATG